MLCEICGQKEAKFKTVIEGTTMSTCEKCKSHGPSQVIAQQFKPHSKLPPKKIEEEIVVEGYGNLIKQAREKKGLSQKEFSEKISEKDSIIHKVETEHSVPPIALAKKIEKFLGIKLVEVASQEFGPQKESKGQQLTIGDNIKIRKR